MPLSAGVKTIMVGPRTWHTQIEALAWQENLAMGKTNTIGPFSPVGG
jgi:hypothetical protein